MKKKDIENKMKQLKKIEFTKEDFNTLKGFLPFNYVDLVIKKLNGKVTARMVKYVLYGQGTDNNNIIETALDIAFEEKKKRETIAKRLAKLK